MQQQHTAVLTSTRTPQTIATKPPDLLKRQEVRFSNQQTNGYKDPSYAIHVNLTLHSCSPCTSLRSFRPSCSAVLSQPTPALDSPLALHRGSPRDTIPTFKPLSPCIRPSLHPKRCARQKPAGPRRFQRVLRSCHDQLS